MIASENLNELLNEITHQTRSHLYPSLQSQASVIDINLSHNLMQPALFTHTDISWYSPIGWTGLASLKGQQLHHT